MEREKLIKHFQYAKEGFAMFTPEGKEILSNILLIQFSNVISDNQIRQAEEVIDIQELEPIKAFLNKNIPNTNRKRKVLRDSVTIDKNGKIFLIECILFLDNSYEISINDISRQEEESRMKRQLTQNVAHELKTPVSSIQDNAIAYAGEGSQIIVNCYKEDPKFYYFSFADNGVGISEEHINRIFERFYRVDKGRSRKVGGTGLGLSIVKNGVNFHKGQISAKSSPGKGVTFFFTLK